ncbi:5'-deoxyadenosine deaminase [Halorientalis pallida]|uniref:5'-deoxyadenosine deaminase n=1 Tax=Halorientalis pallida TaxID=2479928 RepID=A0A498KUQ1_9EURY|nr:5'-deoxyadenosine deaminase [Halorientalis pallida]RXK47974.1 5'-deoxyadenosine deaminase [Halorientalis pallida]
MLLTGTVVRDSTTVVERGAVVVADDRIEAVGPADELVEQYPSHERRDFDIVAPGIVQSHVHSVQVPGRGLADDTDLFEWLEEYILPIEAEMTAAELELASTLTYIELIENGTTCCIDHLTVDHSDGAFEAAGEIGIKAAIGNVMMDRESPEGLLTSTGEALAESERLLERYHRSFDDRIRYAVTPRFTPTCTEECLRGARELADREEKVRIHTHASENEGVVEFVDETYGTRDIEWLHEVGLTGSDVVLAHVILTSEREREILAETGTHVCYCPSSNMKIGAGIAPVVDYLDRGINVAVGNDGAPVNNTMDPFVDVRQATLLQKIDKRDPTMLPAETVFEMATVNGAEAIGFEKTGKLEEGWAADVIGLASDDARTIPMHDAFSHLVYAATGSDVQFTMVDGEVLLDGGEITTVDAESVKNRAREAFPQLAERAHRKHT